MATKTHCDFSGQEIDGHNPGKSETGFSMKGFWVVCRVIPEPGERQPDLSVESLREIVNEGDLVQPREGESVISRTPLEESNDQNGVVALATRQEA